MRLTPFAKFFITVVIIAVVGYVVYDYKGADLRKWATGDKSGGSAPSAAPSSSELSPTDFSALKDAPKDPARDTGSAGVRTASLSITGKLKRPLVVAINTWAGHAPGVVFNNGLAANSGSFYQKKFGMD